MRKPILIAVTGEPHPEIRHSKDSAGDFSDWIAAGLGPSTPHRCLDARTSPALPNPVDIAGVVVTGSHAMVSERAAWSERLGQWLKRCVDAEVPVLGICYGHQLLAHALGGRVGDHPAGLEIGTHAVELTPAARQDPLFAALPESFPAQFVHRQSALELPPGATRLARNAHEPHQAFRIGKCAWGVQFHPEFSATAMQGYLDRLTPASGTTAHPTPEAASLLARFAVLALDGPQGSREGT